MLPSASLTSAWHGGVEARGLVTSPLSDVSIPSSIWDRGEETLLSSPPPLGVVEKKLPTLLPSPPLHLGSWRRNSPLLPPSIWSRGEETPNSPPLSSPPFGVVEKKLSSPPHGVVEKKLPSSGWFLGRTKARCFRGSISCFHFGHLSSRPRTSCGSRRRIRSSIEGGGRWDHGGTRKEGYHGSTKERRKTNQPLQRSREKKKTGRNVLGHVPRGDRTAIRNVERRRNGTP